MSLPAPLRVLMLVAAIMPQRCSAKFVNGLILDEAVAEACSADWVQPSPTGMPVSSGTKKCIEARLQRARYLRANGHLEASLKDFRACADLLPGEFATSTSPEVQELRALSTAIALQREGRQQFMTSEELEERNDRSGARDMYQQSIVALRSAARYLIDLRAEKTNAHAKSLTDLAAWAERRSQEFESEF